MIPREDRVVNEFLRNTDQTLSGLVKEGIPIRRSDQSFVSAFFALNFDYYYVNEYKVYLNQ